MLAGPRTRMLEEVQHHLWRFSVFVALRDLKHARGRFALISVVIVLITLLVTMIASLTAGLARESTSAITDLPADHITFSMPSEDDAAEFTASSVTSQQWQDWADVSGVESADPLGLATTRAESDSTTASVTALGVAEGSQLVPWDDGDVEPGTVVLTPAAADGLDADAGDTVTLGGQDLTVAAITSTDESFSHTPVVWTSLDDWQSIGARAAASEGTNDTVATVITLTTSGLDDRALAAADDDLGTKTVTTSEARSAVPSFAGENTSLTTTQAFLLVISALVVGAFFTVWTISRSGDIAVLKALGASTGYLLKDALGQAALLLIGGVAIGTGLTVAFASLLPDTVPVIITSFTTLVPAAGLILLGLVGAAISVARITRIDPHAALAAR